MSYKYIRQRCEDYHGSPQGSDYDNAYNAYFNTRNDLKWENYNTLDESEIENLIEFLDNWGCFPYRSQKQRSFLQTRKRKIIERLPIVLQFVIPTLETLKGKSILDNMDFESIRISYALLTVIDGISDTIASKILHTINPEVLVMCDERIKTRHGHPKFTKSMPATHCKPKRCANWYVKFLQEMQEFAQDAVDQAGTSNLLLGHTHNLKIRSLRNGQLGLAKVIDEHNYMLSR